MNFDETKFYLGTLCKRNHEFENSGQSLRYIKNNKCCPKCTAIRSKKYLNTKKGKIKSNETKKQWRKNNPKKLSQYKNRIYEYHKQWRRNNPEKLKLYDENYKSCKKNRDKLNKTRRTLYKKNPIKMIKYSKEYRKKNYKKCIKKEKKRNYINSRNLRNSYIKQILKNKKQLLNNEITPELIYIKRLQLILERNKNFITNHNRSYLKQKITEIIS